MLRKRLSVLCAAALMLLCTACGQSIQKETSSTQTSSGQTLYTQSETAKPSESAASQTSSANATAQTTSDNPTRRVKKQVVQAPASTTITTTVSTVSRLPKNAKYDERFGLIKWKETQTREGLNGRKIDFYQTQNEDVIGFDHATGRLLSYHVGKDTWNNRPQNGTVLTAQQRRETANRYARQYVDLSAYTFSEERTIADDSYTLYYTKKFAGYRSKDFVVVFLDKFGNFNHIEMEGAGLLDGVAEPKIDKEKVAQNLQEQLQNRPSGHWFVNDDPHRNEYITMMDDKLVIEYMFINMYECYFYVDVDACLK